MASPLSSGAIMAFDEISSLDWRTLEKIARITFTGSQRKRLLKAVNAFLSAFTADQQLPHVKDLRGRLQQIKKTTSKLSTLLADSSPLGQTILNELYLGFGDEPWVLKSHLQNILFNFKRLEQEKSLVGKAGAPPNVYLSTFLRTWYEVYREAGSTTKGCYWSPTKQQYCGPFLDLVQSVIYELNARLSTTSVKAPALIQHTRQSLAQAILPIIRPKPSQRRR